MQSEKRKIDDRNYQINYIAGHLQSQMALKHNATEQDNSMARVFGDNVKLLSKQEQIEDKLRVANRRAVLRANQDFNVKMHKQKALAAQRNSETDLAIERLRNAKDIEKDDKLQALELAAEKQKKR